MASSSSSGIDSNSSELIGETDHITSQTASISLGGRPSSLSDVISSSSDVDPNSVGGATGRPTSIFTRGLVPPGPNPHLYCRKFFKEVQFSWVDKVVLGQVRRQRKCRCCWVIAALSAMESDYNFRHGDTIRLAVQEMVDCYKHRYPNKSYLEEHPESRCYTNNLAEGFKYVKEFGICEESSYPFEAARGDECKPCRLDSRRFTIDDFEELLPSDEDTILAAIHDQPIAGGIRVPNDHRVLLRHKKGIYQGPDPGHEIAGRHAFLIIGYGEEKGVKYYLIRNSWGTGWGVQGYGKIARHLVVRYIRPINTHLV